MRTLPSRTATSEASEGNGRRTRPVRLALALLAVVLGFMSVRDSLANALAKADAARAHALAPGNGVISALYAQELFSSRPNTDPRSSAAQAARDALLDDATAADALTVLAFQAQLRGDREKADAIFRYSSQLSRRELRPRLWQIEAAVARGDIAGALRQYDIALRTSKEAGPLLYPTLGAAMAEP